MKIMEHIESLSAEGRLMADAAEEAGTGAPVPTCPGWRVRDLLDHTAAVHRWAAAFVTEGHRAYVPETEVPELDGTALVDRFRAGHQHLVTALENAPEDLECWTFLPAPSPLAFWARRQAHETRVHRFDAESALGRTPAPVAPAHAEDGLDELLRGFHARPKSRVRTDVPRTLRIRTTDTGAVWDVRLTTEPPAAVRLDATEDRAEHTARADCEVAATAGQLYLALWNRAPLDALPATGDTDLVRLWQEHSAI
ncbi:maleylpyruvate isomerase family mycothiol-dependent enzyme [Streptomyces sp. NPDC059783]|uniref:maleylpyruvate isomerase family mycothiol-dependent enzyme n=1 Tax=Streptomyces sp. NPDC059783 TaxID=3346944 RepID=UPI00365AAA90